MGSNFSFALFPNRPGKVTWPPRFHDSLFPSEAEISFRYTSIDAEKSPPDGRRPVE